VPLGLPSFLNIKNADVGARQLKLPVSSMYLRDVDFFSSSQTLGFWKSALGRNKYGIKASRSPLSESIFKDSLALAPGIRSTDSFESASLTGSCTGNIGSITTMDESDSAKHSFGNRKGSAYVRLAVGGMTCVACSRAIKDAVSELEGISDILVNQVGKSASAVVTGVDLVKSIVTVIEDIGYECKVIAVTPVVAVGTSEQVDKRRNVTVEFKGMESL